jgi:hypothetical protein
LDLRGTNIQMLDMNRSGSSILILPDRPSQGPSRPVGSITSKVPKDAAVLIRNDSGLHQ